MNDWVYCPRCANELAAGQDALNPSVHCSACGFARWLNPLPTTIALIVHEAQVLLVKRDQEPRRGAWDAVGGFLTAFETAEDCVRREALEEIGLEPRIERFLGTFTSVYGDTGLRTIGLAYLCSIDPSVEIVLSAENDDSRWFPLGDLPEIAFADVRAALSVAASQDSHAGSR